MLQSLRSSAVAWPALFSSLDCCEDMLNVFYKALHTGLDLLMPVKRVRVNISDVPWMTQHLKSLILKRQKAFHEHVLNQLSLSSTVTQSTANGNHVKLFSMKPRYIK